jgi:hypothetical protein
MTRRSRPLPSGVDQKWPGSGRKWSCMVSKCSDQRTESNDLSHLGWEVGNPLRPISPDSLDKSDKSTNWVHFVEYHLVEWTLGRKDHLVEWTLGRKGHLFEIHIFEFIYFGLGTLSKIIITKLGLQKLKPNLT